MPFNRETEKLISALRGLPEELDDPAVNRGVKDLAALLDNCIDRYHLDRNTPEETILENWERIVGKGFASRCRPERLEPSGTLRVQATNPTVRRELIFMEDRILTAIASLEGCQHIRKVLLRA